MTTKRCGVSVLLLHGASQAGRLDTTSGRFAPAIWLDAHGCDLCVAEFWRSRLSKGKTRHRTGQRDSDPDSPHRQVETPVAHGAACPPVMMLTPPC